MNENCQEFIDCPRLEATEVRWEVANVIPEVLFHEESKVIVGDGTRKAELVSGRLVEPEDRTVVEIGEVVPTFFAQNLKVQLQSWSGLDAGFEEKILQQLGPERDRGLDIQIVHPVVCHHSQ